MKDDIINNCIKEYLLDVEEQIKNLDLKKIHNIVNVLNNAYRNGKNIFVVGNGGSAATAIHISCDLGKGTVKDINNKKEKRFRVFPLTANIATITAIANDINYEEIFSQQLLNIMSKGDVLIAISASGNSKNIIKAVEIAKEFGLTIIGLIGFDGGKLKDISDYSIVVRSNSYGVVEDIHHMLGHILHYCLKSIKD